MYTSRTNNERWHGIDFARAVMMILGLFYHTGLIYAQGHDWDWSVTSNETSLMVTYISDFIFSFRMEAFYLISGFFYILIFTRGREAFLWDRVARALFPMIFCGLVINTVMNYYSFNNTYDWGSVNYFIEGQWIEHLWYLGNLIVYFVVSFPLCKFILTSKPMSAKSLLLSFYFIVPFVAVIGFVITKFTFDGKFIFVWFKPLLYQYCYFLLGCFCFRNKELFLSLLSFRSFILSFSVYVLFFLLSYFKVFPVDAVNDVFALMAHGGLTLSMISVFYAIGTRDSKMIRSFSDSSFTVYVVHQPLIILLYVFVFDKLSLGVWPEYLLIIALVFFVSYYFHVLFVKNGRIMKLLFNGVLFSRRSLQCNSPKREQSTLSS